MTRTLCALLLASTLASAQAPVPPSADVILRAMKDEAERSRTLAIASLDNPYYIEYALDDVHAFSASASLGALVGVTETRFRIPRVRVRVGDYDFDNTNYVLTDFAGSTRYDPDPFPIDDDYGVIRRGFWLATDRAYKAAVESIARKRAALKNIAQSDKLPDFWKAPPANRIDPVPARAAGWAKWPDRVKLLSQTFLSYPEVVSSSVSFNSSRSVYYLHNSEGTSLRHADPLAHVQMQAQGFAPDGATVRDSASIPRWDETGLPAESELRSLSAQLAGNVRALIKAPVGESYSGPVLVEGIAGPQLIAELLAPNLAPGRRPIGEPGRPVPFFASELEGRIESRVLPEFLDVVDDPTQTSANGVALIGGYSIDEEGVAAKPLTLIEKGRLKAFLLTRQPVRGFTASNGRGRLPGPFGARAASASNLFVRSSESMPPEDLRKKLLELVQARNKPYGIIVRKMDFPFSGGADELRRMMTSSAQSGGGRPVSPPLLVYRIYPDGREELVRGLRFRGLSVRSLRDIMAVSSGTQVLHYLNNLAPLAMLGGGSYAAPVSVVAPSLLFDELELEKPQDDNPKLPAVPPPPLTPAAAARTSQ
jgi:hypothetical protein